MKNLTDELEAELVFLLKDIKVFFTKVSINGKSTKKMSSSSRYDLILGYCKKEELFIAWNGYLHMANEDVSIVKEAIKQYDRISYTYGLYNKNRTLKEKKVLIPKKHIKDFCHRIIEYMLPNCKDEGFNDSIWIWKDEQEIIINNENSNMKRNRIIKETYERNSSFRDKVLDNYGNKCAVCRTDIIQILEAAHIDAVYEGGSDSLGNGICLCRNHHKLFDSHLLHFNNDYTFYSEELSNDEYFSEIIKKYEGKLLIPKVRGCFY